jgi:hypothetical protein
MLYPILEAWGVLGYVLWGERLTLCFVEKCSVSLVAGRETDISGEYLPTLFAPLVPPYGAGETSLPLPILGSHWEKDTPRTATRPKQDWSESGVGLELD